MLDILKRRLTENVKRFAGRKDFLEAVCAASALIAIADGEIEEKEEEAVLRAIGANPALSAAFDARTIETTAEAMFARAKGGRMGRAGLYHEIEDIAKDPELSEMVLLAAMDVADSDGEVEPQEKVVIEKIAASLRLDPKKYDV